jgi:hypothetical protein
MSKHKGKNKSPKKKRPEVFRRKYSKDEDYQAMIFFGALIMLVALFMAYIDIAGQKVQDRCTERTTAVITEVKTHTIYQGKNKIPKYRHEYIIRYKFEVDGKEYEDSTNYSYDPGDISGSSIPVYYNPDKPSQNYTLNEYSVSDHREVHFFFAGAGAVLLTVGIIKHRKFKKNSGSGDEPTAEQ